MLSARQRSSIRRKLGVRNEKAVDEILCSIEDSLSLHRQRLYYARITSGALRGELARLELRLGSARQTIAHAGEPIEGLLMSVGWQWRDGREYELTRLINLVQEALSRLDDTKGRRSNWPLQLTKETLRGLYFVTTQCMDRKKAERFANFVLKETGIRPR